MFSPDYTYRAAVLRVVDGDTYAVRVDLGLRFYHDIHIRLHDFDTPELRSTFPAEVEHAKAARDTAASLLPPGTQVVLTTVKTAVYNRWEAAVYVMIGSTQFSMRDLLLAGGFAKRVSYQEPP